MKVKPLDDRVLVEVAAEVEKTVSGLIIPDTAKEKPRMGKVVAVGTDEDLQELIKVGDNILFAKYGGEDITVGKDEYKIVQRADILAVIED
ncbi:MAG: co-chaperone GroES [Bacteroidetes bacterium]|nr:co-chaperone GroES [Bacteroidota bacterium]MBU1114030.1 co-chaperone GroES [Bacteroidota bacterium]MBU1798954.1 co-chaperone GroES [Bacteroidota bacterium]